MKREIILLLAPLAVLAACSPGGEVESAQAATASVPLQQVPAQAGNPVAAANALIGTMTADQRAASVYAFTDSAQKVRWSNLPTGIFARRGLRFGDLQPAQLTAAHNVLRAALSPEGYQKVVDIINADEALRAEGSNNANLIFGEDEYYLAFLGTPSATEPWMLQFGGHHLAINVTFAGSSSVLTPSLPAAQPATFTLEGRTIRPLGDEYDKAFALMGALDASQRQEAVLGFQVRNLVLGPGQDGRTIQPEGLRASRLNASQQTLLWDLAGEWVNILNAQGAAARMAELRANVADTYFAWSGATTKGSPAYFRIQGPTVVIEYAPQGAPAPNDQGTNHIHTIYRDPTNDYGAGIARSR